MINLKEYRKNIYQNEGLRECPHYGEDGVILKIFEIVKPNKFPLIIEFGETRSLGTTTRSFRIKYKSKSIYFTGDLTFRSTVLNILDIFKIAFGRLNPIYLKFLFNMPFKFFVTPENVIDLFNMKKVSDIDILCVDIDSYDYFIARKILSNGFLPKLLILEYNYSLGYDKCISYPYPGLSTVSNKRAYGASYLAMFNLASMYNYKLVHISGFCNLFFVRDDFKEFFYEPDLNADLIKNKEDIDVFLRDHCQNGFFPSWYNENDLKDSDLDSFKIVD